MNKKIPLYNRTKKSIEYEKVFEQEFMDFVYGTRLGRQIEKRFIMKSAFSVFYGFLQRLPSSRGKIPEFIENHGIDIDELEESVSSFHCFNDFFKRRLRPESRPIDSRKGILVSPCDGRLLNYRLEHDVIIPVKGREFSLSELLGDKSVADRFNGGCCLIYRLAPMDYHRFCYIDNAVQHPTKIVNGGLHSVSQLSLEQMIPVFIENYREFSLLSTETFGDVVHMDVGALVVGKIVQNNRGKVNVMRGEEKGHFEFGGSTIILLFEEGQVEIDKDIVEYSELGTETVVKMGESVGIANR